jgi:hypothetical protein
MSFVDISNLYANQYKTIIKFTHVWSDKVVSFKAFLTDYSDDYNTEWNTEQVYGRNDPIQTFKSTSRTINLGWDVPAASFEEAAENMSRAALLVKFLYPTYDGANQSAQTISRPPLVRVSFQNLIQGIGQEGLLCTMDGISFSPDLDAGWFDVGGINTLNTSKTPLLYPKLINFNCKLTIMHESSIGWNTDSNFGISENLENFPFLNNENKIDESLLGSFELAQKSRWVPPQDRERFENYISADGSSPTALQGTNQAAAERAVQEAVDNADARFEQSDKAKEVESQEKSTNPQESSSPAPAPTAEQEANLDQVLANLGK